LEVGSGSWQKFSGRQTHLLLCLVFSGVRCYNFTKRQDKFPGEKEQRMSEELKALIEQAIAQEELSQEFYQRMADLSSHKETKETFAYLAKEELEHKAFLKDCLTPAGCTLAGTATDTKLAEIMQAPSITEDLSPKEALVVAMKREQGSYDFYKHLASLQPPGDARAFLEKMAEVELSHKEKVEYLYDNAAFPEVW
jgi:rubrerythrin